MGRLVTRVACAAITLGSLASAAFSQVCGGDCRWIRAEALVWSTNGVDLPALVTSSPSTTALADAGELGLSTTTILAGDGSFSDGARGGYRISGGFALDSCNTLQLVSDFFRVGNDTYKFEYGDTTNTIITRPFFNSQVGEQDSELVSVPGQLSGRVLGGYGDRFQGAGIGLAKCLSCASNSCNCTSSQLGFLGGYRYYRHNSELVTEEELLILPNTTTPLIPGTTFALGDYFDANNEFHGLELGLQGRLQKEEWWLDGSAAFAIGTNRRTLDISGITLIEVPDVGSMLAGGGLLTSPATNIGRYKDSRETIIPRLRIGLGCQLTCRWSATVGYNAILWKGVATGADGLPANLRVDPRNLPPVEAGAGRDPEFAGFGDKTFIAQGLDFGATFAF